MRAIRDNRDAAEAMGKDVTARHLQVFVLGSAVASPWGRMMRAIRDNRDAAEAMGKDVTARHLQVFVLGSAVVGVAGAMLVTLDGQFTPGSYTPLRYTFIIWVMVIVGGSGNNWGAVLGAPAFREVAASELFEDAVARGHLDVSELFEHNGWP
ncbi:hypothetical protein CNY89_22470, partial [Amaricoccus sp. HAR-UPW-R2A-40]